MTVTRRDLLRGGGAALVLLPVVGALAATAEATSPPGELLGELLVAPASRLHTAPSPGKCGSCGDGVREYDAVLYCRWCAEKALAEEYDDAVHCSECDDELDDRDGKCGGCALAAEENAREAGRDEGERDAEEGVESEVRQRMEQAFGRALPQLYGIRDDLRDRGMDARYWMRLDDVIAEVTKR